MGGERRYHAHWWSLYEEFPALGLSDVKACSLMPGGLSECIVDRLRETGNANLAKGPPRAGLMDGELLMPSRNNFSDQQKPPVPDGRPHVYFKNESWSLLSLSLGSGIG